MRFNKIGLRFYDIDQAAAFFVERLSFVPGTGLVTRAGKRVLCLENNNFILELFESGREISGRDHLKFLSFEVDNIRKTAAELESGGVEIIEGLTKASDLNGDDFYYCYFQGPESLKLGFFQKYEKESKGNNN